MRWLMPLHCIAVIIVSPNAAFFIPIKLDGSRGEDTCRKQLSNEVSDPMNMIRVRHWDRYLRGEKLVTVVVSRYLVSGMGDFVHEIRDMLNTFHLFHQLVWHEIPFSVETASHLAEVSVRKGEHPRVSVLHEVGANMVPVAISCGLPRAKNPDPPDHSSSGEDLGSPIDMTPADYLQAEAEFMDVN